MDSPKVYILFVCLMALITISIAQNTPDDYVNAHNVKRKEVGAPDLVWDETLANYAQKYVSENLAVTCQLKHSQGQYGENLAMGSWDLSAQEAVDMWYEEKQYYNELSNACEGGVCGHYTQVVWAHSERVGCANVKCQNGWTIISCNYDPPGNYVGERPY